MFFDLEYDLSGNHRPKGARRKCFIYSNPNRQDSENSGREMGREIRLGVATSSAYLRGEFAEVHASSVAKRSLCPDRKAFRVLG